MSASEELSPEQRATLAQQIGDARPASDGLLMSFGQSVQDRRDHDHTTQREDWYCLNLAAYMGERAAPVLRRLFDAEAELERLRRFASVTDRRDDEIRARLAMVDIRDSAEAWDLGMAVIAILEGPLNPDSDTAPRLDGFEAVISTSDGSYGAADEYRCRKCGAIGTQGTETKTLADLIGMVLRHECLPRVEGGE